MNHWRKSAKEAKERAYDGVKRLCDMRMKRMAEKFSQRFPKRHLHIRFGNGTHLVEVDDKPLFEGDRRSRCLAFVTEAMDDVVEMSENYTLCSPDDVECRPHDPYSDDRFKPGEFNFRRAWRDWARPMFLALPADLQQIYHDIRDHYPFLNQQEDLSVRWPRPEEEMPDCDPLRTRFNNCPAEFLAMAIPRIYDYGHWGSGWAIANDGGAYWKFEHLAKQVLIAKGPEWCTWDKHQCDTDRFKVRHPHEIDIDNVLEGTGLVRQDVINVNFDPHPFMIGPQHFPENGGRFIKPEQAPCAMRGCNLSYYQHTSERVLVIKGLRRRKDKKPVAKHDKALRALASVLEAHKIDGVTFVEEDS